MDALQIQAEHDKKCRYNALDLLARREHSVSQLQTKLRARDYSAEVITQVLDALQREGYVSDQRYASAYSQYRLQKGYGPVYIQAKLRQAGVDDDVIALALSHIDKEHWGDVARQVYQQKFRTDAASLNEKAKRMRFLQQRGFLMDHIKGVVNTHDWATEG